MNDISTTELKPAARLRLTGLDPALLILFVTSYAYALGFAYEYGYLAHFGIPVEFVEIGLRELLVFGALTMGAITAFYFLLDFLMYQIPNHVTPVVRGTAMYVGAFAIIMGVILRITHVPWFGWLLGFGFGPVWLTFENFVAPIWRQPNTLPYWRRVEAETERRVALSRTRRSLGDAIAGMVGPGGFLILLMAVAALFIVNRFGDFQANQDEVFLMPSSGPACIALREETPGLLCVAVDQKTRSALPEYRFLDPKAVNLVLRRVGPFAAVRVGSNRPAMAP